MTKKDKIYLDYLIAKILGEEVKTVHKKHNLSRMYVHRIVTNIEKGKDNLRQFQYVTLAGYLNKKVLTKREKEIQTALVRDMYKNGYSMKDIKAYTGKPLQNIRIIIWG